MSTGNHASIAETYAAALKRVLAMHATKDHAAVQAVLDERQPLIDLMEADVLSVLSPEHRAVYVAVMEQTALDAIWWFRQQQAPHE